ncbi:MAG: hypothetical protein ACOZBH_05405 [Patescibacteria group bacterium]
MTLRKYLIILLICTTFCWLTFVAVLMYTNPGSTNWIGFSFLYLSLFVSLIGTFSIGGILFRWVSKKQSLQDKQIDISSRQSIILSFFAVVSLFLQSLRLLTWWNLIILVAVISLVEIFFISHRKFRN